MELCLRVACRGEFIVLSKRSVSFALSLLTVGAASLGILLVTQSAHHSSNLIADTTSVVRSPGSTGEGAVDIVAAPLDVSGRCNDAGLARARSHGRVDGVAGAFATTASEFAVWQETRHGPTGPRSISPWRSRPGGEPIALCYYDGLFEGFPRAPRLDGAPHQPYERIAIVVSSDATTIDAVGPRDRLEVRGP